MKSSLPISAVVAISPAVLITAPLSNINPLRLIRISLPFALNKPAMIEGSLSKMRLSATEFEFGCTNMVEFVRPDIEALPVDDRLVAGLRDGRLGGAGGRDRGLTGNDFAALGIGERKRCDSQRAGAREEPEFERYQPTGARPRTQCGRHCKSQFISSPLSIRRADPHQATLNVSHARHVSLAQ